MANPLLLIVNPQAAGGRSAERLAGVLAELRRRGLAADQAVTNRPGHALELARAASGRYQCVAAVGGDGTVNEVASGLLLAEERRTVLGLVPVGTGNDVAQLFGIRNVADAVDTLARDSIRSTDVIEVRCHEAGRPVTRYALLFASVGFAGELLRRTTPRVKRLFGPRYSYSVGFLRALISYRAPSMKVICDGEVFTKRMFLVCAGNAEYAGGGVMRLSPGARIDDGELNLSLIDALGPLEVLRYFPKLLKGEHVGHPRMRYKTGTTLAVETDPEVPVQLDGDVFGGTPAQFTVRPAALKVLSAG